MIPEHTRVVHELEYERESGLVERSFLDGYAGGWETGLPECLASLRLNTFNPLKRWRLCRTTYEAGEWNEEA